MRSPWLITLLLVVSCFSLGVTVEPNLAFTQNYERHDKPSIEVILGDARRLFAGHFLAKADVYFHSGYYPSIFDQAATNRDTHLVDGANVVGQEEHDHETDIFGKPLDCIDKFGRAFFPSTHSHLDEQPDDDHHEGESGEHHDEPRAGKVREMLPWLKMTAALDPNRTETYTVGAYWLRTKMGKIKEAEEFLRDGLRANPASPAILFELGRIYHENYHQSDHARYIWEAALKRWNEQESNSKDPDTTLLLQIVWQLALVEQESGNRDKAISYLEIAKKVSPTPDRVQERIEEIRARK